MSNVNDFKSMRNIGNAYVEMRKKEVEAAQAKAEAAQTVVEKETAPTPADATVEPTEVKEEVIPQKSGAQAFKQGSSAKLQKTHASNLKTAIKKSQSLTAGDEEPEDEKDTKKAKNKVTINPDLKEDGHTDVSSAIRKCKTIVEDAQEIMTALQAMGAEGDLPTWWTNKMAVSANSLNSMRDYIKNPSEVTEETLTEKPAGWIAIYNGKSLEIRIDKDAKDLFTAKQFAISHFKVPKSKQGLLAIAPAY
jgi:hypothetical protein